MGGHHSEYKTSLSADDVLLYLSNTLSSLKETTTLLDTFGRISGYRVNIQKSELPIHPAAKETV